MHVISRLRVQLQSASGLQSDSPKATPILSKWALRLAHVSEVPTVIHSRSIVSSSVHSCMLDLQVECELLVPSFLFTQSSVCSR